MNNKSNIIITNEAKVDVKNIVSYISIDNKLAGLKFANLLKKIFVYLSEFPNIGKKRPEYTDLDVLFLVIKWGYNIVYKIENNNIYILRILSEYQDYNLMF